MADDNMTLGYLMGQEGNGSHGGIGDFGGIWGIILLAMILGYGGNGGLFGGYGGGGAGFQGVATRADINEGFALNGIENGIRGIQQGICDSTYGLTGTINGGFNALSGQLAQCCCDNRAAIADLKYGMSSEFCALGNSIQGGLRDVIDNQNANYRGLMDFMVQSKIDALQSENQTLKLQASQAAQNSYLAAMSEAQTAELIRRIAPVPVPSYSVPAPYPYGYNANCGCC